MIRAFAPGITMQDPLAQTSSNFDVRHEPTAGAPDPVAVEPSEPPQSDLPAPEAESEFARLEQLLSSRTRERRELALELERRGALLRDACTRLSELAPRVAESQLQKERDAAVARAVDAEVARAEATFKLDEVLGQLLALGGQRPAADAQPTAAREPTLASRLLELDELKQMADARVLLLEHELAHERGRMASAVRERVESVEHFEFELSQARAEGNAARHKLLEAERASEAARSELETLSAEIDRAQTAARDAENENSVLRSQLANERGALSTEFETERALRLDSDSELKALRAAIEHERTALREQLYSERSTLQAELESDRHALRAEIEQERAQLNDISERERAAMNAASVELQRVRSELLNARDALVGELDGLRFRLLEAELALRSNAERLARSQHQVRELEHKLDAARSERAGESARVEALLVQLQESGVLRAADQESLRELRAEREQTAAAPMLDDLRAELTRERAARAALVAQLSAAASAGPSEVGQQYASQQMRLEALRACLLELRLPLVEFESGLEQIAQGKGLGSVAAEIDHEALNALEEQLRVKELRIQELEAALSEKDRPERVAARDISTLKGELIDVRANAARLSDDLAKERARRRKMAVTVRALQAATDSGEAPGPWIEELVAVINEGGSSLPPKG